MKNYTVIRHHDFVEFRAQVNRLLDLGYVLIGGVFVDTTTQTCYVFYQALAMPETK